MKQLQAQRPVEPPPPLPRQEPSDATDRVNPSPETATPPPSDPDRQTLDQAYQLAKPETPEALANAIVQANLISVNSPLRLEADQVIAQWGEEMLAMAQRQAESDIPSAIAIAQQIPAGNDDVFARAQALIEDLNRRLNPESP